MQDLPVGQQLGIDIAAVQVVPLISSVIFWKLEDADCCLTVEQHAPWQQDSPSLQYVSPQQLAFCARQKGAIELDLAMQHFSDSDQT